MQNQPKPDEKPKPASPEEPTPEPPPKQDDLPGLPPRIFPAR